MLFGRLTVGQTSTLTLVVGQVFGNSPDETAYCRVLLNRETTTDAILMIQPAMQAYSMNSGQPEPVMLDVASVMPDRVLLLDSYFTVVVWHGSTVAQWRKADYHLQEEYAHLKPLMEVCCMPFSLHVCACMRRAGWLIGHSQRFLDP